MLAPGRQDTPHTSSLRSGFPNATPYTPATLASIKEYESTIKDLQNENWQLKLRIFYLTQSVERFKPEDGFNIKENIEQKVVIEKLQRDLEEKDALLLEARATIQRYVEMEASMLEKTFSDLNEGEEEERLSDKRTNREQHKLKEENNNLREMIQEQATAMEELMARLESSEGRNKELQSSVQSSEEAVAELQETLRAQEQKLVDPSEQLQQKVVTLEEQLQQYDQELQKRSVVSDEIDKHMLTEYEEAIKFYEKKTKDQESDNAKLLAAVQEKDGEIAALADLKEEHLKSQEQARQLEEQLEVLRGQVQAAKVTKQAHQRTEEENRLLKEQLDANLKMMEDYLKMMEQMGTKYKALQASNKELIEENRSLREQTPSPTGSRSPSAGPALASSHTPSLGPGPQPSDPLSHTLSFSTVTPARVSPILAPSEKTEGGPWGRKADKARPASADTVRHRSSRDESGTATRKSPHGERSERRAETPNGTRSETSRKAEHRLRHRRRSRGYDHERYSDDSEEDERDVRKHERTRTAEGQRRGEDARHGAGDRKRMAKEESEREDGDAVLPPGDVLAELVQQIRERDDFLGLIVSGLKDLHKSCAQGSLNEESRRDDGVVRWEDGFAFDLSTKSGRGKDGNHASSYAFSSLQPRKSSSLALHIRVPPSSRDFNRLSVALMEQKLVMEESFLLLASLVRKKDEMNRTERERLEHVVTKYKCELNSLKMQLKHFRIFNERGRAMPRTHLVERLEVRGDESDEEYDDGSGEGRRIYMAGKWNTREQDDVQTIFNRLKSNLRKERDQDLMQQSNDEDKSNQELLWALKEVQAKVERLQESNRVLTMELEEKRGLIEKINSLYKNIPQLLQSPTLSSFNGRSDFVFLP